MTHIYKITSNDTNIEYYNKLKLSFGSIARSTSQDLHDYPGSEEVGHDHVMWTITEIPPDSSIHFLRRETRPFFTGRPEGISLKLLEHVCFCQRFQLTYRAPKLPYYNYTRVTRRVKLLNSVTVVVQTGLLSSTDDHRGLLPEKDAYAAI